ncbi:MAG: toxin-antitoxin system TumE family protein [Thermodesulfobacteriota bacterium]
MRRRIDFKAALIRQEGGGCKAGTAAFHDWEGKWESNTKPRGQKILRGFSVVGPALLAQLTTAKDVVIISNMKAVEFVHTRNIYSESAFAELVLWRLPKPLAGCWHEFKYRLAYVVQGESVLRYDNEADKGDHRPFEGKESAYRFTTPDQLVADFQRDIERWNHENLNA